MTNPPEKPTGDAHVIDEKALQQYDLAINDEAYAVIERDFHEVLSELISDQSLETFKVEYEKLHDALRKSHDNEKVLVQRVKELAQQLAINNQKIRTSLKLSKEDQAKINSLKLDLQRASELVNQGKELQDKQQDKILELQSQVNSLKGQIDATTQGAALQIPEEQSVEELQRAKAMLLTQIDEKNKTIQAQQNQYSKLQEAFNSMEENKAQSEIRIKTLKEQLSQQKAEASKQLVQREMVDNQLTENRNRCEQLEQNIMSKEQDIEKLQMDLKHQEEKLKSETALLQKSLIDVNQLNEKWTKQKADNNKLVTNLRNETVKNKELEDKVDGFLTDQITQRQQTTSLSREIQKLNTTIDSMSKVKQNTDQQIKDQNSMIQTLEKDILLLKQKNNQLQNKTDEVGKENKLVTKTLHVAKIEVADKSDLLIQQENQVKIFENEISAFRAEAQKQRNIIFQLEKEREQYSHSATEMHQKFQQAQQELKMRELSIQDLQKRVADADNKLRQKQALYEEVRAERNLNSKNLVEAQDEISELRRQFRVMSHVIDQLKQEIQSKDQSLLREHFALKTTQKEKDAVVQELERAKQNIMEASETAQSQKAEIAKLNHMISENELERNRQQKEYKIVIQERDILGTQLIRRNDELSLLYEKVRIYQATLAKGEKQYGQRISDINLLRTQVTELRRQIVQLRRQAASIEPYRRELQRLQRDLLDERAKTRALTQELQSPMNVHRWRQLEGSDPQAYEMIKKVQHLQKRLIEKTEEVSQKAVELEEKEKLYNDLKKVLGRQPGPEVLEKLNVYQDALKTKKRQLQSVTAELTMFQAQSAEYRNEITKLTQELQEVKRKYFVYKRKEFEEMTKKTNEKWESQGGFAAPNAQSGTGPKFVGGGFAVVPRTGPEEDPYAMK